MAQFSSSQLPHKGANAVPPLQLSALRLEDGHIVALGENSEDDGAETDWEASSAPPGSRGRAPSESESLSRSPSRRSARSAASLASSRSGPPGGGLRSAGAASSRSGLLGGPVRTPRGGVWRPEVNGTAASLPTVPKCLRCALSGQVMTDPVVAADGLNYEREHIVSWLRDGHLTSPVTGELLSSDDLQPNPLLNQAIQEYMLLHTALRQRQDAWTDYSMRWTDRISKKLSHRKQQVMQLQSMLDARARKIKVLRECASYGPSTGVPSIRPFTAMAPHPFLPASMFSLFEPDGPQGHPEVGGRLASVVHAPAEGTPPEKWPFEAGRAPRPQPTPSAAGGRARSARARRAGKACLPFWGGRRPEHRRPDAAAACGASVA